MLRSKYRAGIREISFSIGWLGLGLGTAFTAQKHYVVGPALLALAAFGLVLAIQLKK